MSSVTSTCYWLKFAACAEQHGVSPTTCPAPSRPAARDCAIGVTLSGSEPLPFHGFSGVFRHAFASGVHDRLFLEGRPPIRRPILRRPQDKTTEEKLAAGAIVALRPALPLLLYLPDMLQPSINAFTSAL